MLLSATNCVYSFTAINNKERQGFSVKRNCTPKGNATMFYFHSRSLPMIKNNDNYAPLDSILLGFFSLIFSPYPPVAYFTPLQTTPQPYGLLYVKSLVMKALSLSVSQCFSYFSSLSDFPSSCLCADVRFPVLSSTRHVYISMYYFFIYS